MRLAACVLLASCTPPARLHVPPVRPPEEPVAVPVRLSAPLDARPPGSRADGGFFDHLPLPVVTHGDLNLAPHPIDAIDRLQRDVVGAAAVAEGAAWSLHLVVREHAGRREASSAWWVSKVTAGLSGLVGGLVIPGWVRVDAVVDAELRDGSGVVRARRRLVAQAEERRALTKQSGMWSLWTRRPARSMMERCLAAVHQQLADELVSFLADAAEGRAEVAQTPPAPIPPATLLATGPDPRRLGAERAHPLGGPMDRGQVIGRIGLPDLVSGYDAAVSDHVALLFDVAAVAAPVPGSRAAELPAVVQTPGALLSGDVAGIRNAFGAGARWMGGHTVHYGMEGMADLVLLWTDWLPPEPSWALRPSLLWTTGGERSGAVARLGAVIEPDSVALVARPGMEAQITRTVAIGVGIAVEQPLAPRSAAVVTPVAVLGLR